MLYCTMRVWGLLAELEHVSMAIETNTFLCMHYMICSISNQIKHFIAAVGVTSVMRFRLLLPSNLIAI